jgi:4-amino-4-deoxy-L-arabinose transferase-like glycosyltransferase
LSSPWAPILAIVVFVFLVRLPGMLPSVVDWDESVYVLMARELLHGHLPYTSMFDDKPVGAPAIFALVMTIFGQSVLSVRLLGCLAVIATALLLRATVLRAGLPRPAGLAAALLYGAFTTVLGGLATNTELLFAPCTAAAVYIAVTNANAIRFRQHVQIIATCGLLFGLALWVKYVAALPAVALFVSLIGCWLWYRRLKPLPAVALAVVFGAACALPTALTALVYWSRGDLPLWWYSNFGFMSAYLRIRDPIGSAAHIALDFLVQIWLPVVLGGWAAVSYLREPTSRERPFVLAMVAWLLAESAAVIAPWKFYNHYFLILLPPLCILSGLALARIAKRTIRARFLPLAAPVLALVVALVPLATWVSLNSFNLRKSDVPRQVAAIIRRDPKPSAWVVNSEPIIYFLARIPLPTRFPFPPHLIGFQTGYTRNDAHAEVVRLLASRQTFIVLDEGKWVTVAPAIQPLIRAALARDYELAASIVPNDPAPNGAPVNTSPVEVFRLKSMEPQKRSVAR